MHSLTIFLKVSQHLLECINFHFLDQLSIDNSLWNVWTFHYDVPQLTIFNFDKHLHQNFPIKEVSASEQGRSSSRATLIIIAFSSSPLDGKVKR